MPSKSFERKLWSLARAVESTVEPLKANGGISRTKREYIALNVTEFEYEPKVKVKVDYAYAERDVWSVNYKLLESSVAELPEHKELMNLVTKRYGQPIEQASELISRFCRRVTRACLDGIDEAKRIELVTAFISDLEETPREYDSTVWLTGISLDEDRIELSEDLVLRRIAPIDFETESAMLSEVLHPPRKLSHQMLDAPSAVLEMRGRFKNRLAAEDERFWVIDMLKLYRLGSVSPTRIIIRSESILEPYIQYETQEGMPLYRYRLRTEDIEGLPRFAEKISPFISLALGSRASEGTEFVKVGLERYKGAIERHPFDARLVSATMCLEALYLKSEERFELGRTLAQRTARVLSQVGYNAWEVHGRLNVAYELRSRYVHGGSLEHEDSEKLRTIVDAVVNYARTSLLIFLQLTRKTEKDKFLRLVDKALLDGKAAEQLVELMKPLLVT